METSARYELVSPIGRGRFTDVFKAIDLNHSKVVAVKKVRFETLDNGFPSHLLREISVLRELSHVNVVRLFNVEKLLFGGCQLIFEYGECTLANYIGEHIKRGTQICTAKKILVQILKGLCYCHSKKVMHRDLQPRNILLDPDGIIKLAEFNWARSFDCPHPNYTAVVRNFAYMAPEVLLRLRYTYSIDMWAVGCIFAELVTQKPLFEGTSEAAIMEKIVSVFGVPTETDLPGATEICTEKFNIVERDIESRMNLASLVPGVNQEGLDLLQRMLCLNPQRRITAAQALLHPFLKDFGFNESNLLAQEFDGLQCFVEF